MHTYTYETHLHTLEASACAKSWAVEYIPAYRDAGFHGIIVTDHFFNGNTNIPASLRWDEQVKRFCRGYENAKALGDREGLSVFFGFEACFGEDEYLIYGLDKEWLLDTPEVMGWDQGTLFDEVDRSGGLMIQAHPFRERSYNMAIHLHPYAVHGVEVVNGGNDVAFDQRARRYAEHYGLLMTSGTDIHDASKVGPNTRGMAFDYPLSSIEEFIEAVKANQHYTLLASTEHARTPHPLEPQIPVHLFGRNDRKRRA
ncbi:MAG: PHP domain-containing protein [Sphaerochaeta sp.]|nr:PHP domain-containing protein [Sphaerochaeta sp.]